MQTLLTIQHQVMYLVYYMESLGKIKEKAELDINPLISRC